MKTALFGLCLLLGSLPALAIPGVSPSDTPVGDRTAADLPIIAGWGATSDGDGDCHFAQLIGGVKITVPGSERAHDLSAENNMMNSPRITQKVHGDFSIQVRVDGAFEPGEESTQPGRTGYTGAGLVVFGDQKNYVTIARAALQTRDIERTGYVNFEMRVDGENVRFGTTGDRPVVKNNPLFLRLEKKGKTINGYVSDDGVKWEDMGSKDLPDSWPDDMEAGVAAVSTSKQEFAPTFHSLEIKQATAEPAPDPALTPAKTPNPPETPVEKTAK
jgi:regulation of enolase protein 1 (concanavalin A-like superfamily)